MQRPIKARYLGNPQVALWQLEKSCREIRYSRQQAAVLMQAVRDKAAARLRRRKEKASQAGFHSGQMAAGRHFFDKVLRAQELYDKTIQHAEEGCRRTVSEVAEAVVGKLASESTTYLLERVREALQGMIRKSEVKILLHGSQVKECRERMYDLPEGRISIEACPAVSPGDALIVSPAGSIQLRWREHLQAMIGDPCSLPIAAAA